MIRRVSAGPILAGTLCLLAATAVLAQQQTTPAASPSAPAALPLPPGATPAPPTPNMPTSEAAQKLTGVPVPPLPAPPDKLPLAQLKLPTGFKI